MSKAATNIICTITNKHIELMQAAGELPNNHPITVEASRGASINTTSNSVGSRIKVGSGYIGRIQNVVVLTHQKFSGLHHVPALEHKKNCLSLVVLQLLEMMCWIKQSRSDNLNWTFTLIDLEKKGLLTPYVKDLHDALLAAGLDLKATEAKSNNITKRDLRRGQTVWLFDEDERNNNPFTVDSIGPKKVSVTSSKKPMVQYRAPVSMLFLVDPFSDQTQPEPKSDSAIGNITLVERPAPTLSNDTNVTFDNAMVGETVYMNHTSEKDVPFRVVRVNSKTISIERVNGVGGYRASPSYLYRKAG